MNSSIPCGRPLSIRSLLQDARARIDSVDAELLLMHALGVARTRLFTHADAPVAPGSAEHFAALVQRRVAGEPVAYLVGCRGFWSFDLEVTPATLIPRPETELLVELALQRIPVDRPVAVADLGTGSGAIALAIANERLRAQVVATDASQAALEVAKRNAARLGIGNVEFRLGDWCAALDRRRFDLIASNPPYIASGDMHLREGDLRFEPTAALASGPDGLDAIRAIAAQAPGHLLPGGWLLVEHGWEQGPAVRAVFTAAGFGQVATVRDLEQRDRVTLGCTAA
ncbi:MAG: Peptide chain release factor N(5)-glutamine methyltransferase [uncultured Lysobacter sp.]|uniref:Release factor glutamine methyltransferase n=1 Tax=uncultured Lysobacter sp. TaxID=271060 RepID=A0A6J4M1J6_9GAMM|nr:MAG: Peptide chain release factor N(5)-glutamine methyltransferase [uncultured Lysobacter sp.]